MEAAVRYLASVPSGLHKGATVFEISLTNISQRWLYSINVETTKAVKLDDIIGEGGAMVEDHNEYGGLADFGSVKVTFPHKIAATGTAALTAQQWQMVVFGQLLAENSGPTAKQPPAGFSVTFLCNGCLSGEVCPPPDCTRY